MDYKIEKGIELPKAQRGTRIGTRHRNSKYPFNKMEAGDSFFVPEYTRSSMATVGNAGRLYFSLYDPSYTVALRKENKGFRVWKVEKNEN